MRTHNVIKPKVFKYPQKAAVFCGQDTRFIGVMALLLGLILAEAAWCLSPEELSKFTSKYYTVYTNLSKKEAKDYAIHMDQTFRQYSKRFSTFRRRDRQSMPLYLVRTRDDYISLLGKFGFDATTSGGMFFRSSVAHGLATWVEDLPETSVLETLQHEGFHQFANAYIGRELPVWVNEGLAEYFGDGLIVGKQMKLGLATQHRVETMRQAVQEGAAINFDELLNITSKQWHQNMAGPRGSLQYQQSWSIVYFLIHGNKGRYAKPFEQYLKLVSTGRNSGKAFRRAFGGQNTTAFRKRWEAFVLSLEPDAFTTTVARMRRLGWGLQALHQAERPVPAKLEDLRKAFQTIIETKTKAGQSLGALADFQDESLYQFTRPNGAVDEFKLLEAQANSLLPRIVAPGLRPEPILLWSKGDDGELQSTIQYR